jgi:hypothetical protein
MKPLIYGGLLILISFYVSSLLGGITNPFGATALVFPFLVLTHVVTPTLWEESKRFAKRKNLKKRFELWKINTQCAFQKTWTLRVLKSEVKRMNRQNKKLLTFIRKLRRTIFLGWLYS